MKKITTNRFLIGSWVSFYPFDIDSFEYQVEQQADAGINFNIFPSGMLRENMETADYWKHIEDVYAEHDMLYFMNGGLNEDMLRLGVQYADGLPHCVGYHLVDEPGGGALGKVGDIVKAYRRADGTRYPFVNLLPSYAGTAVLGGSYYDYVQGFVNAAGAENIDYLSHDFYVFFAGGTNTGIFADIEVMRKVAYENGKLKTHAFPQSTAWNGMRMPTIDEMRWNVYAYLTYGFKALSWFNLVCPGKSDTEGEGFRESVIYRDGAIKNPQLFKDFGDLNREVLALGDTLMRLDTVHAYHTKNAVAGVETLPDDWWLLPADEGDFVIGYMEAKDGGTPYIMVFNKSWEHAAEGKFTVDTASGVTGLEYLNPFTGKYEPADLTDGVLTVSFRAGEGKLYRLKGNTDRLLTYARRAYNKTTGKNGRATVDVGTRATITGVRVTFPADRAVDSVEVQVSNNKRFPKPTTVAVLRGDTVGDTEPGTEGAESFPADGTISFEPIEARYVRVLTRSGDQNLPVELEVLLQTSGSENVKSDEPAEMPAYDVDYTELDKAISAVDALNEADYTPETWEAVKAYYEAAVSMHDGHSPQNAVTVAAWQLMDRVGELVKRMYDAVAEEALEAPDEAISLTKSSKNRKTAITIAAVAGALGAAAGALVGVIAAFTRKKK